MTVIDLIFSPQHELSLKVVVTEGEPDKSVPITHAYNHHYIVSNTFLGSDHKDLIMITKPGLLVDVSIRASPFKLGGGHPIQGRRHQPWPPCVLPHDDAGRLRRPKP